MTEEKKCVCGHFEELHYTNSKGEQICWSFECDCKQFEEEEEMKYLKELKEKIRTQDIKCDELIKKQPFGFHDREFEELVMLKSELRGAETVMKELSLNEKKEVKT